MYEVLYTLIPVVAVSFYFFGISAILMVIAATAGCMATEWFFAPKEDKYKRTFDGSTLLTGVLLGLCLPPGFPLWMAFLGGVVAIGMGKVIWGGLGQNVFNPALVGRAFLQAAFPTAITTWALPDGNWTSLRGTNAAFPFYQGTPVDAVSTATPLSQMKFEQVFAPTSELLTGAVSGSVGETSGILLLIICVYLIVRKIINWRIPVSILGTVIIFSSIFWFIDAEQYPSPWFMLFSGGLMLGAVFMATDMVASPMTHVGCVLYGGLIGLLVVLIRVWGGMPEGVMYAILIGNAVSPQIDRWIQPRVYGTASGGAG